jgi:hypothetical protein
MATAGFDKALQALADVSGIVVDRTVVPEKIIGQGWIISKSRMVVLASSVANYSDAPWALLVKFPYPDLVYSVKSISLHPEFNKRAVRDLYLSQANELQAPIAVFEHDIATITIEAEIPDLQPDRVQELTRALSLPLTISAQDLSGVMRAGDTGNILQKAIMSQRHGVLHFYDERKVPFCRVLLRAGRIAKATFQNLQNEFAICELMWRKPGGNFVLQTSDNLNWSGIPEINMSTEQLAGEASRRTQDLPRMLDALGGPNVRYVRTRPQIEMDRINQQIRWVVERVWPVLDGALPLTRLSERLGIDTYTAIQAIWEMKHHGFVAMANFEQYHRSGQLGPALTPGHEVDLKFWDNLQAFYLDELSTLPVIVQGNYFAATHLVNPTVLLHTMPVQSKHGAIVLKEGRLIGLHNGKYVASMQNPPPFPLYEMSWIGSLADMSAKRMRSATAELDAEGADDLPVVISGRGTATGPKGRTISNETTKEIAKSPMSSDSGLMPLSSNEPAILQRFTKIQVCAGGGAIGLLLGMMLASAMSPRPATVPVVATTTSTATATTAAGHTGTGTSTSASGLPPPSGDEFLATLRAAGMSPTPLAQFQFIDTSKETAPKPSFGLQSERANQKIYFVVWPNAVSTAAVDSNFIQPPYLPLKGSQYIKAMSQGTSPVHDFTWKAARYMNVKNKETVALVGAYPTAQGDKSILVVAMPYKGEGDLDFKGTVAVVERMSTEVIAANGTDTSSTSRLASDADLKAYREKVNEMVKSAYKAPADSDRANKCVVEFVVDYSGKMSKLELKYSSGMEEVDKSLQKAILSKVPYPAPPNTKEGQVNMELTLDNGELTIDEP